MTGKRKRREGEVKVFLQQYARPTQHNLDPNDRQYNRSVEAAVKRMRPEELDAIVNGDELEGLLKEPAVFELLGHLRHRLGHACFVVVDHWEADRRSIGVASPRDPRVLVHLALLDDPTRLDVQMERPATPGADPPFVVTGEHLDVGVAEAADLVRSHLLSAEAP